MTELYDEEGNAIEAFTQEDLESKLSEATQEKADEVAELRVELEKEREKEKNFKNLRDQKKMTEEEKQKIEEEKKTTIEELEKKVSEAENAGVSKVIEMQRASVIDKLADGDEELAAKITENYELINKPEGNSKEIKDRARDAYLLSMDINDEDINGPLVTPSGPGRSAIGGNVEPISDDIKALGKQFGLTDADFKKYSK